MQKALDRYRNQFAEIIEEQMRDKERQLELNGQIHQQIKEKIEDLHLEIHILQHTWTAGERKLERITAMGGRILEVPPWTLRWELYNEVHCQLWSAPEHRPGYRQLTIEEAFQLRGYGS
jgi:hypothetical protein